MKTKKRVTLKKAQAAIRDAIALISLVDVSGARRIFNGKVAEDAEVRELCERYGYGAVMDSAARQWRAFPHPIGMAAHTTWCSAVLVEDLLKKLKEVAE